MNVNSISPQTLRTLCAAGFVAAAVWFTQSQDALREITRPLVLAIVNAIGINAADKGDVMTIGQLEVPWTRDCAGMNLLLIMLALGVWVNREEPSVIRFWLRVAAMVPAALAANVLRVLTLIAYRMVAYPVVESPQTHYFMGFVWMVPFITLITPRAGRPAWHPLLETLHAAAVVALLAPMTGMPNGSLITVAVIMALSQCRLRLDLWNWRAPLTLLWVAAGAGVAMMNMESFWLPWLLCCPLLLDFRWVFTPAGILVMLSTQSMFAMQSWAPYLGWSGIGLAVWALLKNNEEPAAPLGGESGEVSADSGNRSPRLSSWFALGSAACFLVPFLASTWLSVGRLNWQPPETVRSRAIGHQGFEVQIPGQPEGIALVCYAAEGKDRHHTVQVCLKYRGTELEPTAELPGVYTDGKHWLREFFLQDGKLLNQYPDYLKSTFRPGSDPGVHVICIAPHQFGTPAKFAETADHLAESLHQHNKAGSTRP
jgi:exosortase/archaeosortase family protein